MGKWFYALVLAGLALVFYMLINPVLLPAMSADTSGNALTNFGRTVLPYVPLFFVGYAVFLLFKGGRGDGGSGGGGG